MYCCLNLQTESSLTAALKIIVRLTFILPACRWESLALCTRFSMTPFINGGQEENLCRRYKIKAPLFSFVSNALPTCLYAHPCFFSLCFRESGSGASPLKASLRMAIPSRFWCLTRKASAPPTRSRTTMCEFSPSPSFSLPTSFITVSSQLTRRSSTT